MGIVRHLITAFNAGEISPLLTGRVDTQHHAFGLETCENFVPCDEGPIIKRPGFQYIRDADVTSTWLTGFRFNITQEYMLEWGEKKLRFFTNGGRVESAPGVAYELATPYPASVASAVSAQQSFDRQYLDHPAFPPGSINRTGATSFTYSTSAFADGPFADQNTDKTITVGASAASGTGITLTATADIFLPGHVGALFKLQALDFSTLPAWEAGMTGVTAGTIIRSDGKTYQAVTSGSTGTNQPIHTEGTEWDGMHLNDLLNAKGPWGVQWLYLSELFGTVTITAVTDAQHATADVVKRLPDSLTSVPSWRWSHGAFSVARGWPNLVIHWKGRQIHVQGFNLLASVVGDYLNHSEFTSSGIPESDLAFQRTIATEDPPLWIAPTTALLAGTASKELAIGPINPSLALSGSNIAADPQSFYGSESVVPVQAGTDTIFVERGGRRLRASDYSFARNRFEPVDITAAARHITIGGVVQMAYQRMPFPMVHAVRGDGQLVTHPLTRGEMKGFARIMPGGGATILSAVAIVGQDGRNDDLWVLVQRSTPGGIRREIWQQAPWRELGDDQRQAFYVDAGVSTLAAAGQTHFSGLTHLAGQDVVVLADGGVITGLTVDNGGGLDLPATHVPAYAYTMTVGLPYTATAVTLRPEPASARGSIQGLRQRVVKVVLRVLETFGMKVGAAGDSLEEMFDRPSDWPTDTAPPLFTGDTAGTAVECEYTKSGQLRFVSDIPLPGIVNAAMMKLDVDTDDA